MTDSVYTYSTSTGVVIPDTSEIQETVIADLVEALGISETAASSSSTAEGRFVEYITEIRKSTAIDNSYFANQINPNVSDEGFFDAIYALFGGERDASNQSSADCDLTGVTGTIIPAGSFIKNTETDTLWYSSSEATIDENGEATVTFFSNNSGAITAEAGELTQIVTSVTGWETVTNTADATEGSDQQSVASARLSRAKKLAKNAGTTMGGVISNVFELDNVLGIQGRENRTSASMVIDNITIPAKSTWLCVDGGSLTDIAEQYVIHTHGTAFYGFSETETGSYTDDISGQSYSDVYIDRPTDVPLQIEVTAGLTSSTDIETQIKTAVNEWADGEVDGYTGLMLGETVSPFEISGALNKYFGASSIYIQKVRISTVADDSLGYDEIDTELYQKCSIEDANITVISV